MQNRPGGLREIYVAQGDEAGVGWGGWNREKGGNDQRERNKGSDWLETEEVEDRGRE